MIAEKRLLFFLPSVLLCREILFNSCSSFSLIGHDADEEAGVIYEGGDRCDHMTPVFYIH